MRTDPLWSTPLAVSVTHLLVKPVGNELVDQLGVGGWGRRVAACAVACPRPRGAGHRHARARVS
ncbi:hypothetical protein Sviol_49520 [Streptomyces violascens]|uniref:Uncharacterized protein n=1 Tax=Streptomyces violascens TaxID=67381 RepID=A0ABQ3QTB6_9ACTN|nr:hypothetical protein Sviol_49520 [Streptomyces violascens]